MSLFQFSEPEILSFFMVLLRTSVLISILPFFGDRFIPVPVKVLLSLALSVILFPTLVSSGALQISRASIWGAQAGSLIGVCSLEVLFALLLGFVAKLVFDAIAFGSHLVGTFMGFASASYYDPHQETQTQLISEVQMAIAMLIFLAIDGHHLLLRASIESFRILPVGGVELMGLGAKGILSQRLIEMTSQVLRFGLQIAAPAALSIFSVNIVFAVMAKAMPQVNILVLSFSVTALVGLLVLFLSIAEFAGLSREIFAKSMDYMEGAMVAVVHGR